MSTASPTPTAYEQLTEKQRAFVDALCDDPNLSHTQAAIIAGYGKKGAAVEGHRQLRKAKVRAALGERLKDVSPTPEELAARWDRVARASIDDFYSRRKVAVPTKVPKPLAEVIAELEATISFEARVAARSNLTKGEQKVFDREQRQREMRLVRLKVELEDNPDAFRLVDGPPKYEEELHLDLLKAQKLGVLDLAKSIKPTAYGIGVELRDPDSAMDKLARMAGAYEKDNEQSRPQVASLDVTIRHAGEGPTHAA